MSGEVARPFDTNLTPTRPVRVRRGVYTDYENRIGTQCMDCGGRLCTDWNELLITWGARWSFGGGAGTLREPDGRKRGTSWILKTRSSSGTRSCSPGSGAPGSTLCRVPRTGPTCA